MVAATAVDAATEKMTQAGVDPVAIGVFRHYHALLGSGATGMIPEDSIEPFEAAPLPDADAAPDAARSALARTVVIKLNGGLGTSMGMDRAKSLLEVKDGLSFLDVIARQVLAAREEHDVALPLLFLNSFRTSADTAAALAGYDGLAVDGLPLELRQSKEPKLALDGLGPVSHPADPDLEWCPPGHGDLYPTLWSSGLLDVLLDAGYTQAFVSNSDNLGATPDARVAAWFARSGSPFMIEAVRRTASDRKGGHFAVRRSDGRIVLRETAQTPEADLEQLADLGRHRFMSTNNLWFDIAAMRAELARRDGFLGLPLIRNTKTVDPTDPGSTPVVQIESAMGAAVEVFAGASVVEVGRDRFAPVKTTNDLLVVRSDCYELDDRARLRRTCDEVPYVDLDPACYKLVDDFEEHFADGAPSLRAADSLRVRGSWTFGGGVTVRGAVTLEDPGEPRTVPAGSVLDHRSTPS